MSHSTYRALGHRALGFLPFTRDERRLIGGVFLGTAFVRGLMTALIVMVVLGVAILVHRRAHDGRYEHLRAALRARRQRRYARRAPDPLRNILGDQP